MNMPRSPTMLTMGYMHGSEARHRQQMMLAATRMRRVHDELMRQQAARGSVRSPPRPQPLPVSPPEPEEEFAELLLVGPVLAAAIGAVVALCTGADVVHLGVLWGVAALVLILAGGIFCVAVDLNPNWLATLLAVSALAVMAGRCWRCWEQSVSVRACRVSKASVFAGPNDRGRANDADDARAAHEQGDRDAHLNSGMENGMQEATDLLSRFAGLASLSAQCPLDPPASSSKCGAPTDLVIDVRR